MSNTLNLIRLKNPYHNNQLADRALSVSGTYEEPPCQLDVKRKMQTIEVDSKPVLPKRQKTSALVSRSTQAQNMENLVHQIAAHKNNEKSYKTLVPPDRYPFNFCYPQPKPRHLVFRPYKGDMNEPEYEVRDRGYYFKFFNPTTDIKLIRLFLEDNGF